MTNQRPEVTKLFAGVMPQVQIAKDKPNAADQAATQLLFEAYTDGDGFHCPKCGQTITNPTTAIEHIRDEINASMTALPNIIRQAKPKEK